MLKDDRETHQLLNFRFLGNEETYQWQQLSIYDKNPLYSVGKLDMLNILIKDGTQIFWIWANPY